MYELIDHQARRQHGVISRGQLLELGLSPSAIIRMRTDQRLIGIGRGAYRLAGSPITWRQEVLAAVLATSSDALASHRTAISLLNPAIRGGVIDLVTSRAVRSYRAGIRSHETRDLPAADRWIVDSIPCTAIDRTLIDVGRYVPPDRVGRLLDEAVRDKLTTYERFEERVAALAKQGRNGIGTARLVLEARGFGDGWGFEAAMLRAIRESSIAMPVREFAVQVGEHRYYLDFAYPEIKLGIECDSTMWHTLPHQFEADLTRQNRLMSAGFVILRYTPTRLRREPDGVIDEITANFRRLSP